MISPPPTFISTNNHTGLIAILAGFSVGLFLFSSFIRLYAKRHSSIRSDDITFSAGAVFALVQAGLVFYLVNQGLGKTFDDLDEEELGRIRQASLLLDERRVAQCTDIYKGEIASNLFYIIILFFSKASCALMYMWLTPYKIQKKAAAALLVASFIWLASSLFVEGFLCHDFVHVCSDLVRPTPFTSKLTQKTD